MTTQFSVRLVDGGYYDTSGTSIASGEGANFDIEFSTPFTRVPNVQITPYYSTSSLSTVQEIGVGLTGSTTVSGCTVRLVNNGDSARTLLGFTWLAVQIPLKIEV